MKRYMVTVLIEPQAWVGEDDEHVMDKKYINTYVKSAIEENTDYLPVHIESVEVKDVNT